MAGESSGMATGVYEDADVARASAPCNPHEARRKAAIRAGAGERPVESTTAAARLQAWRHAGEGDMASSDAGARANVVQRGPEAFQTADMEMLRSLLTSESPGVHQARLWRISWHRQRDGRVRLPARGQRWHLPRQRGRDHERRGERRRPGTRHRNPWRQDARFGLLARLPLQRRARVRGVGRQLRPGSVLGVLAVGNPQGLETGVRRGGVWVCV
jgi:hypothetical protein